MQIRPADPLNPSLVCTLTHYGYRSFWCGYWGIRWYVVPPRKIACYLIGVDTLGAAFIGFGESSDPSPPRLSDNIRHQLYHARKKVRLDIFFGLMPVRSVFGVLSTQVYRYYDRYRNDRAMYKFLVRPRLSQYLPSLTTINQAGALW